MKMCLYLDLMARMPSLTWNSAEAVNQGSHGRTLPSASAESQFCG